MAIPGFTASAALAPAVGRYPTVRRRSRASRGLVLGQIPLGEIRTCGPCVRDPDSTTGWSRTCREGGEILEIACRPPPPPPPPSNCSEQTTTTCSPTCLPFPFSFICWTSCTTSCTKTCCTESGDQRLCGVGPC